MQFLKENNIIKEYVLPIMIFPVFCILTKYLATLVFLIGKIYGTFFRGLFEMALKNI